MEQEEIFEITIIGGGPAGLYSAFYSGLRGMKTKIIEYQPMLGGKIHVYPEKIIWDVGGLTPVPGEQLIEQLVKQGLTFNPDVVLGEKVEQIVKGGDGIFLLKGSSGRIHRSRTVIAAVGGGILNPQRLDIEGAERFEVANLNYTVKSLKQFKDKIVLISGGGNSAVDWANELLAVAKQVYVAYRKESLSGHEASVDQLLGSSAQCLFNTSITRLIAVPSGERIGKVELTHAVTGEKTELEIDEVVINHGYERESSLLDDSPLELERVDDYYIKGNGSGESSVPGFYAAGDILMQEGKLHLIAGTFQDAANAVNRAKLFVQPQADETGMVSSHNDRFKERNREIVKQLINN
ncbi:NAD(P)/FAD-dependent oxidoreductase [Paenibacillus herberti]|uniref:Ferredoxin--NADP reductase n=1 Tax=Paenibacillus herberti TaxID=1619309 RepID=A0A229P6T8_9BACL|nr:NAD(P)/FAD-dependent oxidoreductase [Paenibacillus herberti]OXM17569.1 thioredoxin reductase [Paenibacillus herberti]